MPLPRRRESARKPSLARLTTGALTLTLLGSALVTGPAAAADPIYKDPAQPVPARVNDLLSRMSLDEKIGQMTQAERASVSAADLTTYRIGSLLSGGGSAPSPNTATAWADMYDNYQRASLATPLNIPLIYGVDAVHGHNNVRGATLFPHNIGLGATRDPELVRRIGEATAKEVSGTGIDWDFAPCLCVARNDRWGRTYESFGEHPELATSMATLVTGLQGSALNQPGAVLATAKHWIGDGGTTGGKDQGDTQVSEAELRAITPGTTVLQGIRAAVSPQTTVTYDRGGNGINDSYQAAVAVVGETPYAEFNGDRPGGMGLDAQDLATLNRLKAAGVPVVTVLVSGRPLDIAAQLPDWSALVAAWLPGTEGNGVADVLFGDHKPTATLPVSWMTSAAQQPVNVGDGKAPLFGYGAGERFPATQNPYNIIGAAYYDEQRGTDVQRCTDAGCGRNVGWIAAGDHLGYADVDFGATAPRTVTARLASGASTTGTLEFRLGSPAGPVVATVSAASTGGWQSWASRGATVSGSATGVQRLHVVAAGGGGANFANLNWFQFAR